MREGELVSGEKSNGESVKEGEKRPFRRLKIESKLFFQYKMARVKLRCDASH